MAVVHLPHWEGAPQDTNPVLGDGVIGIDDVSGVVKRGDGTTLFSALAPISVQATAPASATAAGKKGQIAFDATHIYVCINTNVWVRATLATW